MASPITSEGAGIVAISIWLNITEICQRKWLQIIVAKVASKHSWVTGEPIPDRRPPQMIEAEGHKV